MWVCVCVRVRCSNLCKETGSMASIGGGFTSKIGARSKMGNSVYGNPPIQMDGHINSSVGQRFCLW